MTPILQQSVRFRTTPQALFDLYMDSKKHSRTTGAPSRHQPEGRKQVHGIRQATRRQDSSRVSWKQIVQFWRTTHWKKDDWSILVLNFSSVAGGAQIDLVHIGVPTYDQKGVRKGWPKYYWRPWKKCLSQK